MALLMTIPACGVDGGEESDSTKSTRVEETTPEPQSTGEQLYPDVVDVEVTEQSGNVFRFEVTISSPYDTPERYADAWRVMDEEGTVYGMRELLHDHAAEQPFTRALDGVEIPDAVEVVTVEGRDLVNGWGGTTMDVALPRP